MPDVPDPKLRIIEIPPPDPVAVRCQRDQRRAVVACLIALVLAGAVLFRQNAIRREAEWLADWSEPRSSSLSDRSEDESLRRKIVGRWQRSFFGRQELTILPNGTAAVVAHPNGFWAWLLGDRLEVRFAWQLRDGLLIYHVTGGRPEAKIEVARSMWGDHFVQRIRTLNETTLILEWADGDIDHWFRCRSRVSER